MPTYMNSVQRTSRKLRTPEFPFYAAPAPMVITPFHISPVLPGETLTNILWQFRSLTPPLRSQVVGWWAEVYFFYVKLSQLDNANLFIGSPNEAGALSTQGMILNQQYDPSGLANTATTYSYHEDTASINYVKRCRDIVVREFFRDEGEDETTAAGLYGASAEAPMVHMRKPGWMDSIALTSDTIPPAGLDLPDDVANATMRDLERLQQQWEFMNQIGLTQMTYEDFVRQFGVAIPGGTNARRPELLRYEKYWQLPSSSVTAAADGASPVSSVISWKGEGRADKDRLFKEHGFICGYIVYRPKMYLGTQRTAAVSMLDSAFSWAPRMLDSNYVGVTIKDFADGRGPLYDTSAGYTADTKDLFLHGDQFLNNTTQGVATDVPFWTLPSSLHPNGKYPLVADLEAMYADPTSPYVNIKTDGIVRLSVKTALFDTSPQSVGRVVL